MGKRNKGITESTTELVVPNDSIDEVPTDEQRYEALQNERSALLARLAEVEGTLSAEYRNWYLLSSVVPKPVALCREVFVTMAAEVGAVPKRADVLAKCTGKGISPNTAKTQYQVNKGRYERGEFYEQIGELHDAEVGLVTDDEGRVIEA